MSVDKVERFDRQHNLGVLEAYRQKKKDLKISFMLASKYRSIYLFWNMNYTKNWLSNRLNCTQFYFIIIAIL